MLVYSCQKIDVFSLYIRQKAAGCNNLEQVVIVAKFFIVFTILYCLTFTLIYSLYNLKVEVLVNLSAVVSIQIASI